MVVPFCAASSITASKLFRLLNAVGQNPYFVLFCLLNAVGQNPYFVLFSFSMQLVRILILLYSDFGVII